MAEPGVKSKETNVMSISAGRFIQNHFEVAIDQYGVENTSRLFAKALAEVYRPNGIVHVDVKVGTDETIKIFFKHQE